MSALADYLAPKPLAFGYGPDEVNCLTWAADWIVSQGRGDPAAAFRGRALQRKRARILVERAGGLLAVAIAGCAAAGLRAIDPADARPGDVGVGLVGETDWGDSPVGLIRAGGFWAWLIDASGSARVVIGPAEVLAAWRV